MCLALIAVSALYFNSFSQPTRVARPVNLRRYKFAPQTMELQDLYLYHIIQNILTHTHSFCDS